jgi:hypothetical protein
MWSTMSLGALLGSDRSYAGAPRLEATTAAQEIRTCPPVQIGSFYIWSGCRP